MEKIHPITTTVGLINANLEVTLKAYLDWQHSILGPHGINLEVSSINGDFQAIIKSLLPLTAPIPVRFAFIATSSKWTAYFDNSRTGTNATTVMPVLAEILSCAAIRAVWVPPRTESSRFRYPAVMFDYYKSELAPKRSIYALNDGGKWKFGQRGKPFPFEKTESYSAKRMRDRFTPEMLCRYLEHLGLRPFEEDWYIPSKAWKLEKKGKLPVSMCEY